MKKFSFKCLQGFIIFLVSISIVIGQDTTSRAKKPFSVFIESNYNKMYFQNTESNAYYGIGLMPSLTLKTYDYGRKTDFRVIFPLRWYGTPYEDDLLEPDKYGYSASMLLRLNMLWHKQKEHTFFFVSMGPEVFRDIRKDESGLLWMFQADLGFKINDPDLLLPHTEIGIYSSIPFIKSAIKNHLSFSGLYLRYALFD